MKTPTKQAEELEGIKESEILEEVNVTIDKDAFKKPIRCCGRLAEKAWKKISYIGLELTYDVWRCSKCGKDYLDAHQSKNLQKIWALQMLLEGKAPTMERSLNYDGKTYFVRFPKDLTSGWKRKEKARMTMLTPEKYLVEIV